MAFDGTELVSWRAENTKEITSALLIASGVNYMVSKYLHLSLIDALE